MIAIDVETTGLNPWTDRLLGLSITEEVNGTLRSTYFPWGGNGAVFPFPYDLLKDPTIPKVGHNLRFDIKFLRVNGVEVAGQWEDTKLIAQLIDENQQLGLKPLSKKYFSATATKHHTALLEHLKGFKLGMGDLSDPRVDQSLVARYCEEDTENTYRLFKVLITKLSPIQKEYYYTEMVALEPVLLEMELEGNFVDTAKINAAEKALDLKIAEYTKKLEDEVATETMEIRLKLQAQEMEKHPVKAKQGKCLLEPFNWNSPPQKVDLFYGFLGLGKYCTELTDAGKPTLKRSVLERLILPDGKLKRTIDYQIALQSYSKMKSAYIDGIRSRLVEGKIHGEYYQAAKEEGSYDSDDEAGTVTGRLSHRNPSLGNLPRRQKEDAPGFDYYRGTFVKDLFIPSSPKHCFLSADYSQIELRVATHLSRDRPFTRAFNNGEDPHQQTADTIGISRQAAKTVNFLLIYFGSPWRLAYELKTDPRDPQCLNRAEQIRNEFFAAHPELYNWIRTQQAFVRRWGYVDSMYGRRRRVPDIYHWDKKKVNHAMKAAGNHVVQSVAASICKRAMIKLAEKGFKIVNQVHDEIVCEYPRDGAEEKLAEMKHIMETVETLSIPIEVDAKIKETFK